MNKRVVVTGLGIVAPNGNDLNTFMGAIKKGISGVKYIEELDAFNFMCRVGGVPVLGDETSENLFRMYELDEADMSIKYAVKAGIEAWEDAGFNIPDREDDTLRENAGAIIGTSFGGTEILLRKIIPLVTEGKTKRLGSKVIEHFMPSGAAAALSRILALANQTTANSSACATGTESIIMACKRIKDGQADVMLAGGTDPYSPFCWAGFDSMRVLCAAFNETPEKASRPMSQSAKGFVPAAGAAIVIIEELNHALERGARIYAEIIGGDINSGAQRMGGSMTAPNPKRVVDCISNTLSMAAVSGDDIDLVSGHLTGTMADSIEIKNWLNALKPHKKNPYFNSLKSMTGHLIGAAGAAEVVAAILQIHHNFIHPSINCEDLHPEIALSLDRENIPLSCVENIHLNYVIKASFGFGDVNSCILFKKI